MRDQRTAVPDSRYLRRRGRSKFRIASIAPITSKTQVPVIQKRTSVFAGIFGPNTAVLNLH
eukprot:SAG31_NODE_13236_length_883_cov_1.243622_1_plen_60_part_01